MITPFFSYIHKRALVDFGSITGTCILHSRVSFDLLSFPSVSFGFLRFPLVFFGFLWFPLMFFGLGLVGFYGFPLASLVFLLFVWFPREKQRKAHPRKRHTTQGKFKEAISSQNASVMPVSQTFLRYVCIYIYICIYVCVQLYPVREKQKHIISTNHPKRLKNHTYLISSDCLI